MKRKTLWQLCFQLTCFTLVHECFSLPKEPQVAHGSVEVNQVDSATMEIRPSDQAIINYFAFDIASHEKVQFIQNSSSSCVLNRVVGNDPSQIFGSLESNGKVFLVNPNGIYFGADSIVNVGSFIASTLDIADEDFLKENYHFSLTKSSEIRNEGFLSSIEGSIVLMAPQIRNLGSIVAKAGTVLLSSGSHITLDFVGDGLVQFAVEGSLKESLIEHLGHIKGSIVSLKLPTAKRAIQEIVNLDGMQEGDVFIEENGIIKFVAASTLIAQNAHLEASQLSIEGSIRASKVHLMGKDIALQGAEIDVSSPQGGGEVLIGGEYQGKGTTPYAQTVTMDGSSSIFSNALEKGDGGLVVLWSKDRTLFDGSIGSHGGPLGGNGGLVETSSLGGLGVSNGRVGALAPKGKIGEWLLDPTDVYILPSPGTTTCTESSNIWGNCVDGNNFCNILVTALNSATANVTVQATNIVSLTAGTTINMSNDNVGITLGGCPTATVIVAGDIKTKSGAVNLLGDVVQPSGATIDTTQPLSATPTVPSAGADVYCLNLERSGSGVGLDTFVVNAGTAGTVTIGTKSSTSYKSNVTVSNAYQIITPEIVLADLGSLSLTAVSGVLVTGSTTTFSANGSVTINATIDAQDSGDYNLTILTGGSQASENVTITGAIGGTSPLVNVSIQSTDSISLNSITVKSTGSIVVSDPAIINSDSVITSNGAPITFSSTISDESAGVDTLQFVAGSGALTLSSDIGAFGSFIVTSAGTFNLGGSITAYDLVSITPNLTLTGSSPIEIQTTIGDISLAGVTSSKTQDFTCISLGDTTVGALTGLGNVGISGSTINLNDSVTATGNIGITSHIVLSDALTTITSSANGEILLGSIDGTTVGSQSLTVSTTGAITLGAIGDSVPLINVTALTGTKATVQSILVSGLITIDIPIVLGASATFDTTKNGSTGSNLTLQTINGTTVGGENLTLIQGTTGAVVFEGDIGSSVNGNPIGALDVTGSSITFEGSTVVTKGSEIYRSPVLITQDITFTSLGNITFDGTISPVSGTPSMTFSPGSGALTFSGDVASFNNIIVRNAGSFSSQTISANNLVVSGGMASIFINGAITLGTLGACILDGGPIYLGAQIDAKYLLMHSIGNISNLGLPQPINILTTTLRNFQVFNATNGVIGSIDSPIEINTPYTIAVGADPRADFTGTPNHTEVKEVPSNPPCIVTFNGVTLIDCGLAPPINRFPFLPKYLFYVPGLYSSWDNLSNWEYFEEEPWALGSNPRDKKLTYWIPSQISKEEKIHRSLQSGPKKASKKTEDLQPNSQEQKPVIQPLPPQIKPEEPKVILPKSSVSESVVPNETKSPKVIVHLEVVTPEPSKEDLELKIEKAPVSEIQDLNQQVIPTSVEQKKERVDWEFSIDFGKEPKPLDVFSD